MDRLKRLLARLDKVGMWVPPAILVGAMTFVLIYTLHHVPAVLAPRGVVAHKERNLIVFAYALSLIVVIPVFVLLFSFVWKYREGNQKSRKTYRPELSGNRTAETIWWLVPSVLILVLSVVTWNSSHDLDPYKPLASNVQPITIQVVADDWKWLFIYPQQNIASVNYIQFPVNTPLRFLITSDTVMNSFWIPQLGGQIYAMPGMQTELNLMASSIGNFAGSSANISGQGFAAMKFVARASNQVEFNHWVASVKQSPNRLTLSSYDQFAQPSIYGNPAYYASADSTLYGTIMSKYMSDGSGSMPGMVMQ